MIADVPCFMHGQAHDDAVQAAGTTRLLAQQRGLVVAPLRETMRIGGWSAMFTDFAVDWFPTNDRGHQVWTAAFWTFLESRIPAVGEPRAPPTSAEHG